MLRTNLIKLLSDRRIIYPEHHSLSFEIAYFIPGIDEILYRSPCVLNLMFVSFPFDLVMQSLATSLTSNRLSKNFFDFVFRVITDLDWFFRKRCSIIQIVSDCWF